ALEPVGKRGRSTTRSDNQATHIAALRSRVGRSLTAALGKPQPSNRAKVLRGGSVSLSPTRAARLYAGRGRPSAPPRRPPPAAQQLHISQAAMSQSLNELERAVDQQLMVRTRTHGIRLTSSGRRFLADARELVGRAADVQQEMIDRSDRLVGPLDIGCYTAVA